MHLRGEAWKEGCRDKWSGGEEERPLLRYANRREEPAMAGLPPPVNAEDRVAYRKKPKKSVSSVCTCSTAQGLS
jgi:hypothetical protein